MARTSRVSLRNSTVSPRRGYTETLSKIRKERICPFCEEHLLKHHTEPVLFKNKHWIVTTNAWPYEGTRRHFLLIARRHIEDAADLSPEEWKGLGIAGKRLRKVFSLPASSLFMRSGDTRYTGATVNHLHAQILMGFPRKQKSKPITALLGFQK